MAGDNEGNRKESRKTGQIIERGKNKYLVKVFLGKDGNGKRKYHNKTITGSKRDAQAYLNQKLHEKNQGMLINAGKYTVSEYMDKWLSSAVKGSVREKTYLDYKDRIRLYVTPAIGQVKLKDLKPEQIQTLYNDMQDRGLSARSVRYVHSILKSALAQAVAWNYISINPLGERKNVKLPKQVKKEMKYLSPEQAKIFMEATKFSAHKALFSLLLVSGIRPGEA